jgi:hypothetical protein
MKNMDLIRVGRISSVNYAEGKARVVYTAREMLDSLSRMAEGSETYELIIGGVPVGENRWRLLQISETWETVYNGGELFQAKVSLKLSEYL